MRDAKFQDPNEKFRKLCNLYVINSKFKHNENKPEHRHKTPLRP